MWVCVYVRVITKDAKHLIRLIKDVCCTHTHTYIHTYTHAHVNTYAHTHIHTYAYLATYTFSQ